MMDHVYPARKQRFSKILLTAGPKSKARSSRNAERGSGQGGLGRAFYLHGLKHKAKTNARGQMEILHLSHQPGTLVLGIRFQVVFGVELMPLSALFLQLREAFSGPVPLWIDVNGL